MRKYEYVKKGKKRASMAVMAALLAIGMTACGSAPGTDDTQEVLETLEASDQNIADTETTEQANGSLEGQAGTQQSQAEQPLEEMLQEGNQYFGEITAIDGNTITVEAFSVNRNGGERPEGMNPGEKPAGEAPEDAGTGEKPEGEAPESAGTGEKPEGEVPEEVGTEEKPAGEMPDGAGTGEQPGGKAPGNMDSADITREIMTIEVTEETTITVEGETAELSSLQVGDSILFTMDGDAVVNISAGMQEPAELKTQQ